MVQHFTPHPELQTFIKRFILIRYKFDPAKPRFVNPFPPQPEHCLYFYPYDKVVCRNYTDQSIGDLPHSIVVGQQLSRVDLTMGYNMIIILVTFHPGGLYRLLSIPMHELLGQPYNSTLFLGREIEEVSEQLSETADYGKMIAVVQFFLLKKARRLKRSLPVDRILIQMLQQGNLLTIDRLSQQACVSVRQLERQFKDRIGMPPKLFLRLVRFSKAWNLRERNPHITWSNIAHTCDFADQMHMIRDFKDFAGVTPTLLQTDLEKSPLRLQGETID